MLAIFKKEIRSFFSSSIGYLILGLFLLLNGLFLWIFKGGFNIFDYGFADLSNFFLLAPWVFLFLIPAVSMKSLSEEQKLGTLELLLIKPTAIFKIVLGKFLGVLVLCILAILPTIIYVYSISSLGLVEGNYDIGVVIGSYFGLLFILAMYASIGVFSSSLSDNQILSFIVAIVISFALFYGFEAIATLSSNGATQQTLKAFGAKNHFESIARGIVDTRDIIYFISFTFFFLYLTTIRLKNISR